MSWFTVLVALLLVSVVSYVVIGKLIPLLEQNKLVDHPNERTIHAGVVARGGGLVIVIILLIALLVLGVMSGRLALFGTVCGLLFAWAWLSWWDDRHDLSPQIRLLVQSVLAGLIIFFLGYVDQVIISSDRSISLSVIGALLSWVGIMWFTNLYNFMDGMDGLAAAQTIVGAITIAFWLWHFGDQTLGLACLVLAAASYGFLLWNWHPARVFMGDVGSIGIGAFFAMLFIIAAHRYGFPIISFILLFGLFIFDASVTIVRRVLAREPFWLPHRTHYYQKLAATGMSHDKIVIWAIIIMLICSLFATTSLLYHDIIWLCVVLEIGVLLSAALFVSIRERRTAVG